MIREQIPLTLAEVVNLSGDGKKAGEVKSFIKQLTKIKVEKAEEMKEEFKKLDLIQLKEEHIAKIIDFMPEDAEDLAKILPGVSLDQNGINNILEIVKKY